MGHPTFSEELTAQIDSLAFTLTSQGISPGIEQESMMKAIQDRILEKLNNGGALATESSAPAKRRLTDDSDIGNLAPAKKARVALPQPRREDMVVNESGMDIYYGEFEPDMSCNPATNHSPNRQGAVGETPDAQTINVDEGSEDDSPSSPLASEVSNDGERSSKSHHVDKAIPARNSAPPPIPKRSPKPPIRAVGLSSTLNTSTMLRLYNKLVENLRGLAVTTKYNGKVKETEFTLEDAQKQAQFCLNTMLENYKANVWAILEHFTLSEKSDEIQATLERPCEPHRRSPKGDANYGKDEPSQLHPQFQPIAKTLLHCVDFESSEARMPIRQSYLMVMLGKEDERIRKLAESNRGAEVLKRIAGGRSRRGRGVYDGLKTQLLTQLEIAPT
ncbi:hypothetical protein GQ607_017862 [Colletotrichum asianum]|uniref:Uncharacterized protein n=1 Tax=Colletotrichum asianum TaxID=702518 RepID=A0A8H3VTZ1_9PEZI|nr:hypothetical protein GQ607_017862 [Colletotrichum asianum]